MANKSKNSTKKQSDLNNLNNPSNDNNSQHLQEELDKLTHTFAELKQQHSILENNLSLETQKVDNLNHSLQSEQQKSAEVLQKNKTLNAELDNKNNEVANLQNQISQLNSQIKNLTAENSNLTQKLNAETTNFSNKNNEVANLQNQISQLNSQIKNLTTENSNLTQKLNAETANFANLKDKLLKTETDLKKSNANAEKQSHDYYPIFKLNPLIETSNSINNFYKTCESYINYFRQFSEFWNDELK